MARMVKSAWGLLVVLALLGLVGCGSVNKAEWDQSFNPRVGKMTYAEAVALYGPPASTTYSEQDLVAIWVFGADKIILPSEASPATVLDANAKSFRLMLAFDAKTSLLKSHSCLGRGCPKPN